MSVLHLVVPNQWHATVHDLVEDVAQVRKRSENIKTCCALWEWIQFKAAKWVGWLELRSSAAAGIVCSSCKHLP